MYIAYKGSLGPRWGSCLPFPHHGVGMVVPVIACRVSIIVWTIPVTPYQLS